MAGANLNIGVKNNQFKSGMAEVRTSLKNVQSEFTLAQTRARLYGNETDVLGLKQKELTAKMELQGKQLLLLKSKISETHGQIGKYTTKQQELAKEIERVTTAHKESVEQTGKNSAESKELATELAKLKNSYAQTERSIESKNRALTNLETQINQTENSIEQMNGELRDTVDALEDSKSTTESWNKGMSGAFNGVKSVVKGATVAISAVAGGLTTLVSVGTATSAEITKFSQVTGHSTDEYQRWDSVMKSVGFSMEAASGDIAALSEKMMDARDGGKENSAMFEQLGLSVTDANGKLRSQEEVFNDVIAGLQSMENETERNAIATALLSTTGEELAPILNMTAEELSNVKNNAQIVSEEDLTQANEFKKQWDDIRNTFSNVFTEIAIQLMPIFGELLGWVQNNMPTIKENIELVTTKITDLIDRFKEFPQWLQENEQKVVLVGIALGTTAAAIGIYSLAMNWATISTTVATAAGTAFAGVMAFITSPITITIAIIGALVAAIYLLVKNWDVVSAKTKEVWNNIKLWISEKVNQIKTSINEWIENVKTKMSQGFETAKNYVVEKFNGIKTGITERINGVKTSITNWINGIKTSFTNGFNTAKDTVLGVFDKVKNGIKEKIEWARDMVKGAIDKIKGFFDFNWSLPKLKMPHFSIKGEFSLNPPSIPKIGVDWYYKGGIFNQRTVLPGGIGVGDAFQGSGNNPEAIVPLDSMYRTIENIVKRQVKTEEKETQVVVNLHSSTPLTPSEVARQVKKAQRQLALEM